MSTTEPTPEPAAPETTTSNWQNWAATRPQQSAYQPAPAPKPKKSHKGWWIAAAVLGLLWVGGSLAGENHNSMSCAELNAELSDVRDQNMEVSAGSFVVKPADEWESGDWSKYQQILSEITDRQNRGEACRLG